MIPTPGPTRQAVPRPTHEVVPRQLGVNPETLRNWVQQAEVDEGHRPGVTSAEAQRIRELEREVKELRRANEILRTAA